MFQRWRVIFGMRLAWSCDDRLLYSSWDFGAGVLVMAARATDLSTIAMSLLG